MNRSTFEVWEIGRSISVSYSMMLDRLPRSSGALTSLGGWWWESGRTRIEWDRLESISLYECCQARTIQQGVLTVWTAGKEGMRVVAEDSRKPCTAQATRSHSAKLPPQFF